MAEMAAVTAVVEVVVEVGAVAVAVAAVLVALVVPVYEEAKQSGRRTMTLHLHGSIRSGE